MPPRPASESMYHGNHVTPQQAAAIFPQTQAQMPPRNDAFGHADGPWRPPTHQNVYQALVKHEPHFYTNHLHHAPYDWPNTQPPQRIRDHDNQYVGPVTVPLV